MSAIQELIQQFMRTGVGGLREEPAPSVVRPGTTGPMTSTGYTNAGVRFWYPTRPVNGRPIAFDPISYRFIGEVDPFEQRLRSEVEADRAAKLKEESMPSAADMLNQINYRNRRSLPQPRNYDYSRGQPAVSFDDDVAAAVGNSSFENPPAPSVTEPQQQQRRRRNPAISTERRGPMATALGNMRDRDSSNNVF